MGKILSYPRNYIENFDPIYKGLSTNPELKKRLDELGASITNHNKNLLNGTAKSATEKNYLQGKLKDGQRVEMHQTKIDVKRFLKENKVIDKV